MIKANQEENKDKQSPFVWSYHSEILHLSLGHYLKSTVVLN